MSFRAPDPRSEGQDKYVQSIEDNTVTICIGYPGTGKTFLALSTAIQTVIQDRKYKKIIIIRPYMKSNTGENLGALPGSLEEKVSPFLESVRDNLSKMNMNREEQDRWIKESIDYTVLSMCRGRSFSNCVVIVEEAQNVPIDGGAMKMLFTRIGQHCKMIIAGDLDQCDINPNNSGLGDAIDRLEGMKDVGIVRMDSFRDIQRSGLIAGILQRYQDD